MDMVEMFLRENGFHKAKLPNGQKGWSRQNLVQAGVMDLELWTASAEDRAAYAAEIREENPGLAGKIDNNPAIYVWGCHLYGGHAGADVTQVRTEDGMMKLVALFLNG